MSFGISAQAMVGQAAEFVPVWMKWAAAKEGGAFLDEFKEAGFSVVRILKTSRNARTKHKDAVAADVYAKK